MIFQCQIWCLYFVLKGIFSANHRRNRQCIKKKNQNTVETENNFSNILYILEVRRTSKICLACEPNARRFTNRAQQLTVIHAKIRFEFSWYVIKTLKCHDLYYTFTIEKRSLMIISGCQRVCKMPAKRKIHYIENS